METQERDRETGKDKTRARGERIDRQVLKSSINPKSKEEVDTYFLWFFR